MNTSEENLIDTGSIPLAGVRKKTEFSLVWIIPIVAVLIAAGLVYKAVTEKGPTITLTFKSAEGLEAGKTKIKYKDVEVGQIETIKVSDDLKGVTLTVQMVKETTSYLTEKTRFWIVRARLAAGSVSGLGTLLSGSYIVIEPGKEGKPETHFTGLEIPPVIMSDQPGQRFRLQASHLGSLERGSPVYFKGIKVGQVIQYELPDQEESVDIQVFIEAPYDKRVVSSTRFWFASGLDVEMNAEGLRIDTQSFVSLMIGGLVFANPDHIKPGAPMTAKTILPIHDSLDEAMKRIYVNKESYLLKFENSVRGLSIGAPVMFRGFPIGEVTDINLEINWEKSETKIPVTIEVEPGRIQKLFTNTKEPGNALKKVIHMGLRAQLQTGNILSGALYVALDFFEGTKPASLVFHDDIVEIPTIPSSLNEITSSLTALLNKLEKLPVDQIGDATLKSIQGIQETVSSFKDVAIEVKGLISSEQLKQTLDNLDQSISSIRKLTTNLEQELPPSLDTVSEKTINTLTGIQKVTAPDSALIFELKQTLREFSKTAQSIRALTDLLERHPEAIIQGKGKEK